MASRGRRRMTIDLMQSQRGEVMKVGCLRKKGHVRTNWCDRFFVLTTEGLYYYKNRTDSKPKGVIPLFGCTVSEDTLQKHTHCFTCATAEGKDYPLQASTRDEMLIWITAIQDEATKRTQRSKDDHGDISHNPYSPTKPALQNNGNHSTKKSTGDSDSDE